MFGLILITKKKLLKMLSVEFQKGLALGYKEGEKAGYAKAENKGCFLSVHQEVDEILKDKGYV